MDPPSHKATVDREEENIPKPTFRLSREKSFSPPPGSHLLLSEADFNKFPIHEFGKIAENFHITIVDHHGVMGHAVFGAFFQKFSCGT